MPLRGVPGRSGSCPVAGVRPPYPVDAIAGEAKNRIHAPVVNGVDQHVGGGPGHGALLETAALSVTIPLHRPYQTSTRVSRYSLGLWHFSCHTLMQPDRTSDGDERRGWDLSPM